MRIYKDETRQEYKDVVFEIQDNDRIICYDEKILKSLTKVLKQTKNFLEYRKVKEMAEVGFCSFGIYKDGQCWLNLIKLENQEFKRFGIPSCMLMLMEKYAKRRGSYFVEGKYIPETDGVEQFYNKNHYRIGTDGYRSTVEKSLLIESEINYDHLKKYVDNLEDIKLEDDKLITTLDFYNEDEQML